MEPLDMESLLLGLDCGLTATKAVVFDMDGRERGKAVARSPHFSSHPRWVERDMDALWDDCVDVIAGAIKEAGASPGDIAGVGVTGHGDGVYLVDSEHRPVRPAILSLDSRAFEWVERWRASGAADEVLRLTGVRAWAGSPAALLSWLRLNEPEALSRARYCLSCKDWVKLKLTSTVTTDLTEANWSCNDVRTQEYSPAALRLYGLEELARLLPPVVDSCVVVGGVTAEASADTGLVVGTRVVAGLHDIDASAIGNGATQPRRLAVIAGSFSINAVISSAPAVDPRWSCHSFVTRGRWLNSAFSPASSANLEWFVREVCHEQDFDFAGREVSAVLDHRREVWFMPFLYGSPISDNASAAFVGLRGWHGRGEMLRALFEGVVFNHKMHVDALTSVLQISDARLAGGGSRSPVWCQMFADALGLSVAVAAAPEAGALGAAACAGVGVGAFATLEQGVDRMVRVVATYEPTAAGAESLRDGYEKYLELTRLLVPCWNAISPAQQISWH
jgi:L-xylulokinase